MLKVGFLALAVAGVSAQWGYSYSYPLTSTLGSTNRLASSYPMTTLGSYPLTTSMSSYPLTTTTLGSTTSRWASSYPLTTSTSTMPIYSASALVPHLQRLAICLSASLSLVFLSC